MIIIFLPKNELQIKRSKMKLELFLTLTAVTGQVMMDWVPPLDWDQCAQLNTTCGEKLSGVGNLLDNGGFTNLVSDEKLNIDCSMETKADIHQCYREASRMCRSSLGGVLIVRKRVYDFICDHKQDFVSAEWCLASGALTTARRVCNVGERMYSNEENCRSAPICVEQRITNYVQCDSAAANLFKEMIMQEYTLNMWKCHLLMF